MLKLFLNNLGPELTDSMLLSLSRRITSETDLRSLATDGLGLKEHVIDSHIYDEKKITLAAHRVLNDWRVKQCNSKVAYSRLCEILDKVEMSFYVADALKVCVFNDEHTIQ